MNKKLINKYKPEFDHWLNDGSILVKYVNKNQAESGYKDWHEDNNVFESNLDYLIIINDQYSIYRKALAEGKTIEYLEQSANLWHEVPEPIFILHPTCYRIKSDEPKFKVGDFVTPLNREINCSIWQIDNILSCNTLVSGSTMLDPRIIQPWTPVKGEWCWFYDNCDNRYSHLAQFYGMYKSSDNSLSTFMSSPITKWYYCEPFLNSLPSYLKDK